MFKKGLFIFIFIAISAAILGVLLFWNQVNLTVSSEDTEILFEIQDGEGVKEIGANLVSQGLIRSQFWFETYVYIDRSETEFVAGNYLLRPNMNVREVVRALTVGQTVAERWITVTEGLTARETADYLQTEDVIQASDFLQAAAITDSRVLIPDKQYSVMQDKPANQGLEGYLFPDTYRIYEKSSIAEIIERMLDNLENKFTDYVTGKQALQPSLDDLEVNNPYNTYKYRGLPPGPICNPSLSSIMAALYPEKTEYFYFLTKPDGTTVFSATYDEHLQNKAKYLQ